MAETEYLITREHSFRSSSAVLPFCCHDGIMMGVSFNPQKYYVRVTGQIDLERRPTIRLKGTNKNISTKLCTIDASNASHHTTSRFKGSTLRQVYTLPSSS
eukprot:scaffold43964_cov66-Cyclotella_meneghiniana.AAC.3